MKSKLLLYIGAATCLAAIGAAAVQNLDVVTLAKVFRGTTGDYTLVLNNSNTPSGLSSSYQNNFSGTVTTSNGNSINMSFVNAKSLDGGFAQLANHGRIYNFASSNDHISGINGVKLTGSGSLLFKPAVSADEHGAILADMTPITISAGSGKVSVPVCDYFELEAGDSGASLTSLELSYTCDETGYDVRLLNGKYTGVGDDGYTYKLTINSGSVNFQSINKQTNDNLSGTAELLSRTSARLSLSNGSITYNLTYTGHALYFSSKTGTIARVDFDRLYNVQDFESFSASGQGYTNATTKYQTSGLRATVYADYYTGSSTGEIGGSGWPVMTSGDNTNYTSNKGHNSSKAAIFKFSNGTSMRYIYMNGLYGVNSIIGKGETLSFWARGAYTNTSFNTNHSSNIAMKLYAYYVTPLNPSNQSSVREEFEFTVQKGSEWQHFEMPLTSGRSYYAFGIYAQQSSGSTMYVPFDDFEIYTASPYATYTPEPTNYPEGTFSGTFRFRNNSKQYNIVIAITKSSIGQVAVILDGETNINATGITVSGTSVTIPTSGTYDSKSVGTITATYSASENKLNSISSDGTLKINSSYSSATLVSSSDTFFDCDGSTSDLQSQFTRRYRSMGATLWDLDTSNSDRVTSSTLHHAAGVGAVALRPYHSGQTAIALANDYSGTVAIKHISFWVYNPSASDIRIRCWVYDAANFDKDHANELEATASAGHMDAKAGSWTYIHACHADGNKQIVTFDAKNFQIGDLSGSGAKLVFDNIIIY